MIYSVRVPAGEHCDSKTRAVGPIGTAVTVTDLLIHEGYAYCLCFLGEDKQAGRDRPHFDAFLEAWAQAV